MSRYLMDLHVHSADSSYCGSVPAREIVNAYREAGFNGIAITDHYASFFFEKIKEVVDSGALGEIMNFQLTERTFCILHIKALKSNRL